MLEEILGSLLGACVGGGIVGEYLPGSALFGVTIHSLDAFGFGRIKAASWPAGPWAMGLLLRWRTLLSRRIMASRQLVK